MHNHTHTYAHVYTLIADMYSRISWPTHTCTRTTQTFWTQTYSPDHYKHIQHKHIHKTTAYTHMRTNHTNIFNINIFTRPRPIHICTRTIQAYLTQTYPQDHGLYTYARVPHKHIQHKHIHKTTAYTHMHTNHTNIFNINIFTRPWPVHISTRTTQTYPQDHPWWCSCSVGSLKSQVSFAKEPYKRDYIL